MCRILGVLHGLSNILSPSGALAIYGMLCDPSSNVWFCLKHPPATTQSFQTLPGENTCCKQTRHSASSESRKPSINPPYKVCPEVAKERTSLVGQQRVGPRLVKKGLGRSLLPGAVHNKRRESQFEELGLNISPQLFSEQSENSVESLDSISRHIHHPWLSLTVLW